MSVMRTQFQRHLYPGLRELSFNAYQEKPLQYSQLFRTESSDKAFEEFQSMAGLGLFVKTPEGIEASQDQFYDGYPKRFNHEDYGLAIGFSHQMMRDVKTRLFGARAMDMGRSARATQEFLHASLLNLAFSGAALGPDGKVLCATDHPNIRGGTQSNIISPVGTLSVVTYRRMLTKFRRFFDHTGVRRIQLTPQFLVVPPEEEHNANEIVKSAGRPDTANRADNVTQNKTGVFCYDFLDDPSAFFMLASKNEHNLYVFTREAFDTDEYEEKKPRMLWVQGFFSQSNGFTDWLGVVGSNPS